MNMCCSMMFSSHFAFFCIYVKIIYLLFMTSISCAYI